LPKRIKKIGTLIAFLYFQRHFVSNLYKCRFIFNQGRKKIMNDLFRGLLAGAAAWKLGGGIISTILIFIVVFWLLGKC
jgi:hypothetical protein